MLRYRSRNPGRVSSDDGSDSTKPAKLILPILRGEGNYISHSSPFRMSKAGSASSDSLEREITSIFNEIFLPVSLASPADRIRVHYPATVANPWKRRVGAAFSEIAISPEH